MAINYDKLMALEFPAREFTYGERDTMLYALGLGLGTGGASDASFLYERCLQAVPTLATVVAWDDSWQESTGMDVAKIVHGEQRVTLHRPMPVAGRIRSRSKVAQAFDKGPGRGAVLFVQTLIHDLSDDSLLATLLSTVFARGDGGFGGPSGSGPKPHAIPQRAPDMVAETLTRAEQPFIYRLSGDRNPLHVDPEFARSVGYEKPILHGLCTYGMAAVAIIRLVCNDRASRLTHFEARFTSPVYPGDTLRTEVWVDGIEISFRTSVPQRQVVVLDHGKALVAAS